VNIASAVNQLKEDECLGLANIILDERGGGAKRRGLSHLAHVGGEVISMHIFYRGELLPPQILIENANGEVNYSADFGQTWNSILTSVDTSNLMCWETFNDKVYMCNGVDGMMTWDGSTQAALPSAPNGKFLKTWKDTLWVAGTDDDRVWSSDPGNGDVFTSGNWVDLGKGDGDSIVGLASDGNVLIVPKHKRGFLIYDPTTFANRVFDPDKGAESHFSFVHYAENLYYLSRLGICIYLGDSPSQVISANIDPVFQSDVLNFGVTDLVWGYTHNNRIGWTVPELGTGVPSLQIELLPGSQKRPFTFHRMPVRCFATLRYGTTETLLGGKVDSDNLVQVFKGGTDDGTPFVGVIETKWFDLQNALKYKYLRRIILEGRGNFFVGVQRNYETGIKKTIRIDLSNIQSVWNDPAGDVWNDENWGPEVVLETIPLHPDIYGRAFKFRFSDQQDIEGLQSVDIGDIDYQLVKGNWALYGGILHGVTMGTDLK
jgi:hypothetical protein